MLTCRTCQRINQFMTSKHFVDKGREYCHWMADLHGPSSVFFTAQNLYIRAQCEPWTLFLCFAKSSSLFYSLEKRWTSWTIFYRNYITFYLIIGHFVLVLLFLLLAELVQWTDCNITQLVGGEVYLWGFVWAHNKRVQVGWSSFFSSLLCRRITINFRTLFALRSFGTTRMRRVVL